MAEGKFDYEKDRRIFVDFPRQKRGSMLCSQNIELESQKSQQNCNQEKGRDSKQNLNKNGSSQKREVVGEREKTPEWLMNEMRKVNGMDAKLITEKTLANSDVDSGQGRLLIPWSKIVEMDFLNEEELKIIDDYKKTGEGEGLDVILVDTKSQQWKLGLRRWDMTSNSYYALVAGWNKVVADNKLEKGHKLWIWSFRSLTRLYIVLVPRDPAPALIVTSDSAEPSSSAPTSIVTLDFSQNKSAI